MLALDKPAHERSIVGEITVPESDHPVAPDDPQASLRAELIGKLFAAELDLTKAIAELSRGGTGVPAAALDQRRNLATLQAQVGSASPAALAVFRNEVSAAISESRALAEESRTAAAATATADGLGLSGIASASRQQVAEFERNLHQFDSYLRFASKDDEADYRRREADRLAYIDAERAKGTPEGDLNANAAALGQLADAGAHGATASPDYKRQWDKLSGTYGDLRTEVQRSGGSTQEADARLADDVRVALRKRGRSDQEIDALFAANSGDPVKVANAALVPAQPIVAATPAPEAKGTPDDLSDAMAALRAAGVAPPPEVASNEVHHGLTADDSPANSAARLT